MNFLHSPNIPNQMKIESTHHRPKHLLTYSVFVTFILKEALYVEILKRVATHIYGYPHLRFAIYLTIYVDLYWRIGIKMNLYRCRNQDSEHSFARNKFSSKRNLL